MNHPDIFSTALSVLLIKPRAIGDVLLSTPVITNIKRSFRDITIDFLCESFASDVIVGNNDVRNVISFNKKNDSTLSLISLIRGKKYDIVVDLFCNPRTALITFFSGATYRIGFPFRGRSYAYNIKVTPRGGEVHNVDFNLDVLRHLNIPVTDSNPVFPLTDESERFADQWYGAQNFQQPVTVGINASGGWYTKKWKADSFAALADRIYEEHGWNIVFFWGPGESEEVRGIQSRMKNRSTLIPKTSLKELGALLKRCHYLVSNDSGPMHIAASLGVPTLGIFGPTNPFLQGPYGSKNAWVRHEALDCLTCNLTECPIGNICMTDLSVHSVYEAFLKLVTKNPL